MPITEMPVWFVQQTPMDLEQMRTDALLVQLAPTRKDKLDACWKALAVCTIKIFLPFYLCILCQSDPCICYTL